MSGEKKRENKNTRGMKESSEGIEKLLMERLICLHVQHSTHVSHVFICKRREGMEEARDQIRIDFRRDGDGVSMRKQLSSVLTSYLHQSIASLNPLNVALLVSLFSGMDLRSREGKTTIRLGKHSDSDLNQTYPNGQEIHSHHCYIHSLVLSTLQPWLDIDLHSLDKFSKLARWSPSLIYVELSCFPTCSLIYPTFPELYSIDPKVGLDDVWHHPKQPSYLGLELEELRIRISRLKLYLIRSWLHLEEFEKLWVPANRVTGEREKSRDEMVSSWIVSIRKLFPFLKLTTSKLSRETNFLANSRLLSSKAANSLLRVVTSWVPSVNFVLNFLGDWMTLLSNLCRSWVSLSDSWRFSVYIAIDKSLSSTRNGQVRSVSERREIRNRKDPERAHTLWIYSSTHLFLGQDCLFGSSTFHLFHQFRLNRLQFHQTCTQSLILSLEFLLKRFLLFSTWPVGRKTRRNEEWVD